MSEQVQCSTLDKLFKITERGSSVSRELFAGATTFLCVSYEISERPVLTQVLPILDKAFKNRPHRKRSILHSD